MTRLGLLLGPGFAGRYSDRLDAIERETGGALDRILVPEDPQARVPADAVARIEAAYFSGDVFPDRSAGFFAAALGASNLRWLQCFNAGLDHRGRITIRTVDDGFTIEDLNGRARADDLSRS